MFVYVCFMLYFFWTSQDYFRSGMEHGGLQHSKSCELDIYIYRHVNHTCMIVSYFSVFDSHVLASRSLPLHPFTHKINKTSGGGHLSPSHRHLLGVDDLDNQ